ncbi:hypothetical protein D3C79_719870 [compost metagenome]
MLKIEEFDDCGYGSKGVATTMFGGGNNSCSASSINLTIIVPGGIEIRNDNVYQQGLVILHRDPTQAANGL